MGELILKFVRKHRHARTEGKCQSSRMTDRAGNQIRF